MREILTNIAPINKVIRTVKIYEKYNRVLTQGLIPDYLIKPTYNWRLCMLCIEGSIVKCQRI